MKENNIKEHFGYLKPVLKMLGYEANLKKDEIVVYGMDGYPINIDPTNDDSIQNIRMEQLNDSGLYQITLKTSNIDAIIYTGLRNRKPFFSIEMDAKEENKINTHFTFGINFEYFYTGVKVYNDQDINHVINYIREFQYTDITKNDNSPYPYAPFAKYKFENFGEYHPSAPFDLKQFPDEYNHFAIEKKLVYDWIIPGHTMRNQLIGFISREILKTEEAKYTFDEVINGIEKYLPGFKKYLAENIDLYNEVISIMLGKKIEKSFYDHDLYDKQTGAKKSIYDLNMNGLSDNVIVYLDDEKENGTTYKK